MVSPPTEHSLPVQVAALDALSTLIRVCKPRIQQRRVQVLEGLVKAFVKVDLHTLFAKRIQACYSLLKETAPQISEDLNTLIRIHPSLKQLDVDFS